MNSEIHQKSIGSLTLQRNAFFGFSFLLSISLVIVCSFLFLKNERIVVVPACIEKEFWVDGKSVSPTYLEQFGYFLGQLILSKSPQSASGQRTILLRHTDPSYASAINKKLREEEETLTKQGASYVFYPVDVHSHPSSLEVELIGDRVFYLSGKAISTERECYTLSFSNRGARLLLKGISSEKEVPNR